jgi:membrane protease YdiL (CAAX protease family)
MSKDSSSNTVVASDGGSMPRRMGKATFIVSGTIGLFFLGQIAGTYLMVIVLMMFGKNSGQIEQLLSDNVALQFLTVLCIEIVTIEILWWLHMLRKQPFFEAVGLGSRPKIKFLGYSALAYVVYFVTLLVTVAIITALIPAIDIDQVQQLGFDSAKGFDLVFVFLTLVVLPPIAEEILFRGFLFSRLKTQIGIAAAAIITSTIFALAHTEFLGDNPLNWIAAIDTFVFSFFLIFLYVKTKSLWPSIFLHAIKNCLAFIFLFLV